MIDFKGFKMKRHDKKEKQLRTSHCSIRVHKIEKSHQKIEKNSCTDSISKNWNYTCSRKKNPIYNKKQKHNKIGIFLIKIRTKHHKQETK
jgi:hypothetical protein